MSPSLLGLRSLCGKAAVLFLAFAACGALHGAEVVASFASGETSDACDGYPGTKGRGWLSGWQEKVLGAEFSSVRVLPESRPDATKTNYLSAKANALADGATDVVGGALVRSYGPDSDGVNLSDPLRFEFEFRPEIVGPGSRYVIFDANRAQPSSAGNASWQIAASGGFWRIMDGAANGGKQAEINTGIPVVEGHVYSFVIQVDPLKRVWDVEIADGDRKASFTKLNFRSEAFCLGGTLHFGFSGMDGVRDAVFQYSFGAIRIIPTRQ
ncbi:MAG: hypothetical protein ACOYM3_07140 [Terrimicrobiaceae bacterium]